MSEYNKNLDDWRPRNRRLRRKSDTFFFWAQWLVGGGAIVCLVAVAIYHAFY